MHYNIQDIDLCYIFDAMLTAAYQLKHVQWSCGRRKKRTLYQSKNDSVGYVLISPENVDARVRVHR